MSRQIKFFIAGPMIVGCLSVGIAAVAVIVMAATYVANKGGKHA